jgi:hypothetical protein
MTRAKRDGAAWAKVTAVKRLKKVRIANIGRAFGKRI